MIYIQIGKVIIALLVIVIIIYKRKKKGVTVPEKESVTVLEKKGVTMLGLEIAAADEKEKQRIEAGKHKKSPLPDFDYSRWKDEESLINPIENELDLRITQLCKEFTNADESKRDEIRASLSQDNIYTLLEFAKRASIFAIRRKEEKYIPYGFTAISMIDSERCDFRDVYVTLSFPDYAIRKLNLNSSEFYENAIRFSQQSTGSIIKNCYEKSQRNKSPNMTGGYAEVGTPYGAGFVSTYGRKYKPQKNLVNILFEASEYISKDKYQKGKITIGNSIDAVWFGARGDKHIEQLIAKANGCASLNSSLKDGLEENSRYQSLHVYLSEYSDFNTLNTLVGISNHCNSSSFANLCFAEGDILCMVIERSVRQGVKDYESNESLMRFEDGLRKIIASY